eukprot:scaffold137032_cov14-Tisochrysis_lutea.AAC.1
MHDTRVTKLPSSGSNHTSVISAQKMKDKTHVSGHQSPPHCLGQWPGSPQRPGKGSAEPSCSPRA